jgi:hypothetical protein
MLKYLNEPTEHADLVTLAYEADLLGNIQQALAGLQGFGVMALELIQNADDAGAATLSFDVTDDALFVRNSAAFSTCGLTQPRCPWERTGDPDGVQRSCNFHAISRMGSRNKVHVASQIGRFGIGFVSVYQITDTPIIRSTGIEMQLVPLDGTGSTRAVPQTAGTEFELQWASMSTDTRKALNASPTPADIVPLVVDAIGDVLARGLFFLRNLQSIDLLQNGVPIRSVSIERDDGVVTLRLEPGARIERWKLLSRDASDLALQRDIFTDFPTLSELGRSPTVTVAVPLHDAPVEGLLYAFLPTEQSSGLPLHINADFFPHPTRRMITLTGEQHERYWNELLLDTAAKVIAENFDKLRELLGAERLWALASGAFALKDTASFKAFWIDLQIAAKTSKSVRTVDAQWCLPTECFLPDLTTEAQLALASIGVHMLHESLRPHWTVLSALGATALRLPTVVTALEQRQASYGYDADTPHLQSLWLAVDMAIAQSKARADFKALMDRLKAVRFVLDLDNSPATIASLWRPEDAVPPELIRRYIPDCPIAHGDVLKLPAITEAMTIFRFDDLARNLATAITSNDGAKAVIGIEPSSARDFYGFLTAFEVDPATSKAGALLANVPMLRTMSGFVAPSRGQLPGGFVDPIGHFELIDTAPMTDKMRRLAREVLSVDVLTFHDYVNDHLADILQSGPSREQYVALLTEILEHRSELDAEGTLQFLAHVAFVRTRAGTYARPSDCYYWTAALEALLGQDGKHWVDEDWMPPARAAARFQDLLESKLGMRSTLSIAHIVDRIEVIATTSTIEAIASGTQPIVRHILDRFPRLKPDERQVLEKLKTLPWLPGAVDGQRVQGTRYAPSGLFRSFRAAGYASQVKVIDLPILRSTQAGRSLGDFLDFLALPEEPPTEAVVAHLEHCMAANLPASDVIYAILSERLEKPGADCIDRLAETAFIYDADFKRYLKSDQVFWTPTFFRGHWHSASARMRQREPLYRRLGVQDAPSARNYAALLQEIAAQPVILDADASIHERCLGWLADALEREDPEAHTAIAKIGDAPALLNMQGSVVWPDEAAWLDSAVLAEPFAGALDERLITPPVVSRHAAARLFREFQVVRFSEIARLRLAFEPVSVADSNSTTRLRERADLLLWLAPSDAFRNLLHDILCAVEVHLTEALQVQAEITEYDPPVRSAPTSAAAFYESSSKTLYVKGDAGETIDWTAAFSALFAPLEQLSHGIDMPPLIMTAAFVASLGTEAEAERALRSANYRPPESAYDELPLTDSISDAPEEVAEVEPEVDGTSPDGPAGDDPEILEQDDIPESAEDQDSTEDEEIDKPEDSEPPSTSESPRDPMVGAGTASTSSAGGVASDNPFKSRPDDGSFGRQNEAQTQSGVGGTDPAGSGGGQPNRSGGWQPHSDRRPGPSRAERQERRSRMLSYVNATPRDTDTSPVGSTGDDIAGLIDLAAINAVMKYEKNSGRVPVEQPHNNPGFDIVSAGGDGAGRRLIEVKGLEGAWTERGVKLSHVQFATAQQHPGDYWIYVVEHARDPQNHRVSAVANPFSKVIEYWFDHGWKDATEEVATSTDMNLKVGAKVKHAVWGVGTIEQVNRRGIAISLLVDFKGQGRKLIPFNMNLEFLD